MSYKLLENSFKNSEEILIEYDLFMEKYKEHQNKLTIHSLYDQNEPANFELKTDHESNLL